MTLKTAYRFLRPTLFVVLCYLFAAAGTVLISRARSEEGLPTERAIATLEELRHPDPELSPEDVVGIQLEGLASDSPADGVVQCYAFASPGNRYHTGPLDRFAAMVRNEKYRILAERDEVLIGKPVYQDGNVRVLVTCVKRGQIRSFVWVLARQTGPYDGCWMTEAVFALGSGPDLPPPDKVEVI